MRHPPLSETDLNKINRNIDLVKRAKNNIHGFINLVSWEQFTPDLAQYLTFPHYIVFRQHTNEILTFRSPNSKQTEDVKKSEWRLITSGRDEFFNKPLVIDTKKYWSYIMKEREVLFEVPAYSDCVPYMYISLVIAEKNVFF